MTGEGATVDRRTEMTLSAIALLETRIKGSREDYGAVVSGIASDACEELLLYVVGVAAGALQVGSDDALRILDIIRQDTLEGEAGNPS